MNILDKIVENKKEEVEFQKKNLPLSHLEELIKINNEENLEEKKRDLMSPPAHKDFPSPVSRIRLIALSNFHFFNCFNIIF